MYTWGYQLGKLWVPTFRIFGIRISFCLFYFFVFLFKIALLCALIQHTICKLTSNQTFEINVVEFKVADVWKYLQLPQSCTQILLSALNK